MKTQTVPAGVRTDMLLTDAQRETIARLRAQGWRCMWQTPGGLVEMQKDHYCTVRPDGSIDGDA